MKVNRKQLIKMIKNNEDVSNVDTSEITDMSFLFNEINTFNQDISKWDVSNVQNMKFLFYGCHFNADISRWNISNVTNMSYMFSMSKFSSDISKWNTSNVKKMERLFYGSQFNRNFFYLKKIKKKQNKYSKNIYFIKNNMIGDF